MTGVVNGLWRMPRDIDRARQLLSPDAEHRVQDLVRRERRRASYHRRRIDMTHSYDNTLLQRMGFADPDRRTPAHGDACIEIASDAERFLRALCPRLGVRDARCQLEVPLQQGEGKYATTVGFIDCLITWCGPCNGYSAVNGLYEIENGVVWSRLSTLVEVKTKIHSIGDLLRQMNLYREYRQCDEYVIWSLDSADSRFATLLEQQGYTLLVGAMP